MLVIEYVQEIEFTESFLDFCRKFAFQSFRALKTLQIGIKEQ